MFHFSGSTGSSLIRLGQRVTPYIVGMRMKAGMWSHVLVVRNTTQGNYSVGITEVLI